MESINITVGSVEDAARMYLKETRRCAQGNLLAGMASILLGIVVSLALPYHGTTRIAFPIWFGLLMIGTGIIGILTSKKPYKSSINITYIVFSVIMVILSCVCMIAFIASVVFLYHSNDLTGCRDTFELPYMNHTMQNPRNTSTAISSQSNITVLLNGMPEASCANAMVHWRIGMVIYTCLSVIMVMEIAISVCAIIISCKRAGCCQCYVPVTVPYKRHFDGSLLEGHKDQNHQAFAPSKTHWESPALTVPQTSKLREDIDQNSEKVNPD